MIALTRECRPPYRKPRDRDRASRGERDPVHERVRVWRVSVSVCECERRAGWARRRLRGGPLLVKLVGVEVFGRVVRVVHTWRLRGGRGGVVLAAVARGAAAVRRALRGASISRKEGGRVGPCARLHAYRCRANQLSRHSKVTD